MLIKYQRGVRRLHRELKKGEDLVLLFLRVGVGVIFLAHGTLKLGDPMATTQEMASLGFPFPGVAMLLATIGEFVGGLGLTLGALTRLSALGPLFTMLVAIFTVHLGHGLFAGNGGWEYPLVLLLVCLVFSIRGGGKYSTDAWVQRTRNARGGRDSVQAEKQIVQERLATTESE